MTRTYRANELQPFFQKEHLADPLTPGGIVSSPSERSSTEAITKECQISGLETYRIADSAPHEVMQSAPHRASSLPEAGINVRNLG